MGLFKTCCKKTQANVVDGKLILTCPAAVTPVVWQMDVTVTESSALEVTAGENGMALLVLKAGKGKAKEIATFDHKDKAVAALMAASKALQNAHGQMGAPLADNTAVGDAGLQAPVRTQTISQTGGWFKKIFTILAVLAILFFAYSVIMVLSGLSGGSGAPSRTVTESQQPSSGVPMSADDFLRGR